MIVLDTNVISEVLRAEPDPRVLNWLRDISDRDLAVVTPVVAELLTGVASMPAGRRRREVAAGVEDFLGTFAGRVWPLDDAAAVEYADIVTERRRSGRPVIVMDALIAAIARSRGAAVATRDIDGLACRGLRLVNPWGTPGPP